jgi:prephenate dehydrogenase
MLKVCIVGLGQMGGSLGLALKIAAFKLGKELLCVKITDVAEKNNGIKYKKSLEKSLAKFDLKDLDINSFLSSSLIFCG